jgi:hypothetical protein
MKFTTHPHKSDILAITREELHKLLDGKELSVGAMYVRMEEEPKPDMVYYGQIDEPARGGFSLGSCFTREYVPHDKVKLTFDGATGKLKSVEML